MMATCQTMCKKFLNQQVIFSIYALEFRAQKIPRCLFNDQPIVMFSPRKTLRWLFCQAKINCCNIYDTECRYGLFCEGEKKFVASQMNKYGGVI